MKRTYEAIVSIDTILGMVAAFAAYICVPTDISASACSSIYGTAISVLSILFSIFFASLAVIISFPDNSFIAFIERAGEYFSDLVSYYKTTLFILFGSLLYTLIVYIYVSLSPALEGGNRVHFLIFIFIFTYSLVATMTAVVVILKLTQHRARFLSEGSFERQREEESDETSDATE